jgi:hypothetical protein
VIPGVMLFPSPLDTEPFQAQVYSADRSEMIAGSSVPNRPGTFLSSLAYPPSPRSRAEAIPRSRASRFLLCRCVRQRRPTIPVSCIFVSKCGRPSRYSTIGAEPSLATQASTDRPDACVALFYTDPDRFEVCRPVQGQGERCPAVEVLEDTTLFVVIVIRVLLRSLERRPTWRSTLARRRYVRALLGAFIRVQHRGDRTRTPCILSSTSVAQRGSHSLHPA